MLPLACTFSVELRGFEPLTPSMRTVGTVLLVICWLSVAVVPGVGRSRRWRGGLLYFAAVLLFKLQVGADRLCLEIKSVPELVARVRCVSAHRHPVAFAFPVLATVARLDVVLPHETNDVNDLNGHVTTVVTNAGHRGDALLRPLSLGPDKAVAVSQETQAIRRYLNE
jgi:hypothetical protein